MADQVERLINQYLFYPPREFVARPAEVGLPYENIWLTAADGPRVHGWFVPNLNAESTVLCLHGNAENISHLLGWLKGLFDAGFQIFALDYRGYGQSEGSPTEQGTYQDALAAWHWLEDEIGGPVSLYGRSLGGAVALWLATQPGVDPCAVVVESTFAGGRELARRFQGIPDHALWLPDFYPSLDRVVELHSPLLVIHGTRDELVPFSDGQRLFEAAAAEPKEFLPIEGAHHNDIPAVGGRRYFETLTTFIADACSPGSHQSNRP